MKKDAGLLKSAGVISAAVAISRVTGLAREAVFSWLFGASATFDAYVLGYRIPNLARDLFAEGALSAAFVPTFTRYLATKPEQEARELSNICGTIIIALVGVLVALGILFAPAFVELFASGYHAVPGKFELAVQLVRIMFPFLLLVALAGQAQGILNACHQFGIPALSSSFFNIGSIVCGLVIGWAMGSMVHGMAYGMLCGGAAQLGFQLPAVWRAGFAWRPRWDLRHEGVRHILKLMGPAVIGVASVQINVLVNTNFAASLPGNGPVSWLSYAYRFQQLPMGLFGIAIASATLPRMARSAAEGDLPGFRDTFSRSVVMILLLTVPSAAGLAVLGESMIALVYQHGHFNSFDTRQTALALSCYAIGLASFASLKLIAPAFYALGDARTPMLVSAASIAVNFVTALLTVRVFGIGHAGLALSLSVVSIFNSVVLLALLSGRIGGIHARRIASSLGKILLAAGAMAFACAGVIHLFSSHLLKVLAGIPVGALVFYVAARTLRVEELSTATGAMMEKLERALNQR